jgi:hypothetical protein
LTPHEQRVFAALALNGVPIVVSAPTLEHDSSALYATPAESGRTLQRIAGRRYRGRRAPGQQTRPLTTEHLTALALDSSLSRALRNFVARPELQRRARSVTAYCLDLGDFPAPTSASDD